MLPPFNSNSKQEKEDRRVFCFEEEGDERFRVGKSSADNVNSNYYIENMLVLSRIMMYMNKKCSNNLRK